METIHLTLNVKFLVLAEVFIYYCIFLQTLQALMWIVSSRVRIHCRIIYIQAARKHPDHKIIAVATSVCHKDFLGCTCGIFWTALES